MSGLGKKQTDLDALTSWRRQREGLVRTRKETGRPRRTHVLETAEGGTCQDTERSRPSEAGSHSRDGRGRDLSGDGKKPTDRSALTFWRRQREGLVRTWKETERGALTLWRRQREGLVRTRKETDRAGRTHHLETIEGETCQETERNRPTEVHSLPGERRQRSGLVRTRNETDRPRRTHKLEMAGVGTCQNMEKIDRPRRTHQLETPEGETCQDMERNRPTEADSHSGDGRERDLSGHGKKPNDRGGLTFWRWQREGLVRTWKETD